ncbi:unnamed protein product [Hapterophycus canaliculatus]
MLLLLLLVPSGECAEIPAGFTGLAEAWGSFGETLRSARPHLLAAAFARFASISVGYPLDTIKTRLQLGKAAGMMSIPNMYRGLGSSLVGQVPYGMLTFGTYEVYKTAMLKRFPEVSPAITFCAAAVLGDMTGSLWLVPSEVVKVQMQGGRHATVAKATMSIFKTYGFGGFYRGYSGQLGRDVPFRALQLTSYELLRKLLKTWRKQQQQQQQAVPAGTDSGAVSRGRDGRIAAKTSEEPDLSSGDAALVGGMAGAFSAALTTPLDVVRTRLMVGGGGGAANSWTAAVRAGGLLSGVGTRVFYVGTSSAVFFVVYEAVKTHLGVVSAPAAAAAGKPKQK